MIRTSTVILVAVLLAQPAFAHFPWLMIDQAGKAAYFFGETPADRTYKLPPPMAEAKISAVAHDGASTVLELKGVDTDELIGLSSVKPVGKPFQLTSKVTYGLYHGSRLDYYTIHQAGRLPRDRDAYRNASTAALDLRAELFDTDAGVDVYVSWNGKPLPDVEVRLFCEDGHEEGTAKTDVLGKVSFSDGEVEEGLNGILVGHTVEAVGELDGTAYRSSAHYLTVTFSDPEDFKP